MTIQPITTALPSTGGNGPRSGPGGDQGAGFPDLLTALLGTMTAPAPAGLAGDAASPGEGEAEGKAEGDLLALLGGLPDTTTAAPAADPAAASMAGLLGFSGLLPEPTASTTMPGLTSGLSDASNAPASGAVDADPLAGEGPEPVADGTAMADLAAGLFPAATVASPAGVAPILPTPIAPTQVLATQVLATQTAHQAGPGQVGPGSAGTAQPEFMQPEFMQTGLNQIGSLPDAVAAVTDVDAQAALPASAPDPVIAAADAASATASGLSAAQPAGQATAASSPAAGTGVPTALHPATEQVLERIAHLAQRDGTHRLTIKLQPEALGEVRVVLSVRHGEVQVRITAGEAAAQALGQDSPELRRLLEQSGLGEARIAVRETGGSFLTDTTYGGTSDRHDGSSERHEQLPARTPGSHQATDGTPRSSEFAPDPVPADRPRTAGLDLTI